MSRRDIFTMALRNLFKRKMRTALTVLAVIIGTMLIVIMISIGTGINMSFDKTVEEMGDYTTKIQIYHNSGENGKIMLDRDFDEIMKIEGVQAATPTISSYLIGVSGKYRADGINIMGIRPEAMEALGFPIAKGRALDKESRDIEIVFGSDIPKQFMSDRQRAEQEREWRKSWGRGRVIMVDSGMPAEPPEEVLNVDVLNDKIQMSYDWSFGQKQPPVIEDETETDPTTAPKPVKPYNVIGVGVLDGGGNYGWEYTYNSYMDIDVVKKIIEDRAKWEKSQGNRYADTSKFEDTGYNEGIVKAKHIDYVESIVEKLKAMNFSYVSSPIEYITSLKKQAASLQMFLGIIGVVVVIVAAIGIANTMVMSIYERTQEIGVMKVIGASLGDIGKLFLVEAALIGLIGGVLGIGLSFAVSYVLNNMGGLKFIEMFKAYGEQATTVSYISADLCILALVVSTVIGLISGYLPARRAMKISALSAIRTE